MGSRNKFLVLCFLLILLFTSVFAQPRMAGGQKAVRGQFNFVVALEMKIAVNETYGANSYCSGSLLSERWVLSAAHCLGPYIVFTKVMGKKHPARTLVLAGDMESQKAFTAQASRGEMRDSYKNYTHPDAYDLDMIITIGSWIYTPDMTFEKLYDQLKGNFGGGFDIALFELDQPFPFWEEIGSIKLAKYYNWGYQQGNCVALGFGKKNDSHDQMRELSYIPVHVGGGTYCKSAEPNTQFTREYVVCVRGKKEFMNPCIGDSGGPVVCGEHGKPRFVYGVSSTGLTKGMKKFCGKRYITTSVYIFPNHASDWIGWVTHLVAFEEPTSEQDDPRPAHEEFSAPADPAADPAAAASCGPFLAVEATLFALVVFKSSWDIINY